MRLLNKTLVLTLSLTALSSVSLADPLYTINSPFLTASSLFEQTITESAVVALKPETSAQASGDLEVLSQCLWSVTVTLDQGNVQYAPGKMICVGPKQEVLEAIPEGTITAFGACVTPACSSWMVNGQQLVEMALSSPLQFSLQPRNERQ
ncbi:hypothetical protein [Reinekea sp. G2M2-21]|uniref:hypothetical protein n=1 Tax=Reinekea sp. G2M2-21 TaxID=2788942 RepID=UPI0018A9C869|nr:hypothetical protein [Reinekea sp. G2M2-21]